MSFPFARESPENNEVCPFRAVSLEADKIKKCKKETNKGMKGMYIVLLVAYKCVLKKNKLKKNRSFHALSACSEDKDA